MKRLTLLVAAVLSTAICSPAFAVFTYSLETADASNVAGTLGGTNYDFTSVGTGTLNFYLVQRGMAAATEGARSVNFQFNRSAGSIPGQVQAVGTAGFTSATTTGTVVPSTFQFNNFNLVGNTNSSPIAGTTDGFSGNPLEAWQVGSMTFTGPTGSTATYNFSQLAGNQINVNNVDITAAVNYGGNVVVGVPEPSSLAALGLCGALVLVRRRRTA